jgi:hypothetical protein
MLKPEVKEENNEKEKLFHVKIWWVWWVTANQQLIMDQNSRKMYT